MTLIPVTDSTAVLGHRLPVTSAIDAFDSLRLVIVIREGILAMIA